MNILDNKLYSRRYWGHFLYRYMDTDILVRVNKESADHVQLRQPQVLREGFPQGLWGFGVRVRSRLNSPKRLHFVIILTFE